MPPMKKNVAVVFGGRSPEHDVSVVTGLQVLSAIDTELYNAFPLYIAVDGTWYIGDALRRKSNFLPKGKALDALTPVTPSPTRLGRLTLGYAGSGWSRKSESLDVDIVVPAFHGALGEDGAVQGLLELAGVAYTGMRRLASTVFMDKAATKHFAAAHAIPTLPFRELRRPSETRYIPSEQLADAVAPLAFPMIVKPSHLGSSIGVGKVRNVGELAETLPMIFKHDTAAIVEPFVEQLVEYNVSVISYDGRTVTSAIEQPLSSAEILDFKEKYLSSGGKKAPTKSVATSSEGMLSLTRTINPELPNELESRLRDMATATFDSVTGTGCPRMDFIYDRANDGLYLNEVNPCPGSLGYFLWEASPLQLSFPDLMDHLIGEAIVQRNAISLPSDPVPEEARLLKR